MTVFFLPAIKAIKCQHHGTDVCNKAFAHVIQSHAYVQFSKSFSPLCGKNTRCRSLSSHLLTGNKGSRGQPRVRVILAGYEGIAHSEMRVMMRVKVSCKWGMAISLPLCFSLSFRRAPLCRPRRFAAILIGMLLEQV